MKRFFQLFIIGFSGLLLLAGCEDYLDINEDPNNATNAPLTGLMARTTFETGDNVQNLGGITSFYVQYLASPNEASATDVQEAVAYDQTWFELYDVMTDLSDLEILALEQNAQKYLGVARILKALNLGLTVDMWGDIPYTQAFFAQTITPEYDDQEELYTTVQALLSDGIEILNTDTTDIEIGNDDFIYQGDTEKWLKAAHALKARYFLHTSETPGFSEEAVLAELNLAFESNDDDAAVSYFDDAINPWASVAIGNANLILGGWISEQIIGTMDGSIYGVTDPRMPFLFGQTDAGAFEGVTNGAGRGDAAEQGERSTLVEGTYYSSRTSDINIITFSEIKFIEAEVELLDGDAGSAYNAYLDGIEANMLELGVDEGDITTYLADPNVAVGASGLTRELILKEKYVSLFLNPETWNDARRINYAYEDFDAPANLNPELGGELITRLIYPESETNRNGANVPTVTLTTNLWWDL